VVIKGSDVLNIIKDVIPPKADITGKNIGLYSPDFELVYNSIGIVIGLDETDCSQEEAFFLYEKIKSLLADDLTRAAFKEERDQGKGFELEFWVEG